MLCRRLDDELMSEAVEIRRRKLMFRACRRGFRELDLYMEAFAQERLSTMTSAELDQFETVLELPDQDVYAWILRRSEPPVEVRSEVLDQILCFDYANRTGR